MSTTTTTLKGVLESFTVEGELYERLENGKLRCFACGHRCVIADGLDGICRVRFNRGGKLLVPHAGPACASRAPTGSATAGCQSYRGDGKGRTPPISSNHGKR